MTKYFIKSEYEMISDLLHSDDYNNWNLAFNLIKSHPKYKNFKKLTIRTYPIYYRYRTGRPYSSKKTVEQSIESWLRIIDWIKKDLIVGLGFFDILNFIKRRIK